MKTDKLTEPAMLQVWTPPGREWRAEVVREHGGLLTIGFKFGNAPNVDVGDSIEWAVLDPTAAGPRMIGCVTSTYRTAEYNHVVVSPCAAGTPARKLPFGRKRAINGRKAFRIKPSASDQVIATVTDGSVTWSGRVRDLSIGGLGIYVDQATDGTLQMGTVVDVSIAIPTMRADLHFKAWIVRLNTLGHGRICGVKFDTDGPDFADQQDVIYVYVGAR